MNRKDALQNLSILFGGIMLASSGLLQACNLTLRKRTALTENDIPLLDEIGETIIPATDTSPGAKAAKIGTYMLTMVNDCYSKKQRTSFIEGLDKFEAVCREKYHTVFTELNTVQKKDFLMQLNYEASKFYENKNTNKNSNIEEHYFGMLKSLTLSGYFTSEIGATKALRYEAVPGRYSGCITYKKGDRPWATS